MFGSPRSRRSNVTIPGPKRSKGTSTLSTPVTLDPVDVLIGSPPCVHFSPANRGGGGDREKGMELVRRFLEFVRVLRPRYWVMENVPAMLGDLEAEMDGDMFPLPEGPVKIPVRAILDAGEFGTPQTRRRLFSGQFPVPDPTKTNPSHASVPLSVVLDELPCPSRQPRDRTRSIQDPIYARARVPLASLRDHFEDTRWRLSQTELGSSQQAKQNHPVYGRMVFPDSINRPCRTITATRTRGSRSTIVIPCGHISEVEKRTLTLRECASVQGFPITYQFWGSSMSEKDFLVGNAVPPPVARGIAYSILGAEARLTPQEPIITPLGELPAVVAVRHNGGRHFSMRRRFRGIVPVDWRHDHRVELDNELPRILSELPLDVVPPIIWRTRIYLGYAALYKCYELRVGSALALARAVVSESSSGIENEQLSRTLLSVVETALNGFLDGLALQAKWAGWVQRGIGPQRVLAMVAAAVDRGFPSSRWSDRIVPAKISSPILDPCLCSKGKDAKRGQPLELSARLMASAVALSIFCDRLNGNEANIESLQEGLMTGRGLFSKRVDALIDRSPSVSSGPRQQTTLAVRG